ncbi:MAG TPA: amidohydrolase family protein [Candidatus Acidoferrales bacterium]|nr:amidohydrolase family protein [Candidatus Acidoferrales bacterium]
MTTDWKMVDADGHIRELESDVFEYLPERYRKRREAVLYFPLLPHHGWHRQALGSQRGSFLIPTLKDWQEALRRGNLEAAVLYPTRFMHIGQVGIAEFAVDLARAYNDYLYDRFLRHEPRLKGMAVLPLQDVAAAVAELRRAVKEHSMVGGILPADGLPRPLAHSEFYPLYEEADRLGCMLAVHAQNSLRNNDLFLWKDEAATLAHVWPQMRQFTSFMFSGVLGRLPNLRLAFLEAGSGWAPYLISKMEPRMNNLPRPSKLIERGQIYFQCGEELTTRRDLEILGDECLLWASDFPHEGIVDMAAAVNEFLARADIPPASKRKIARENPKRLYGIKKSE